MKINEFISDFARRLVNFKGKNVRVITKEQAVRENNEKKRVLESYLQSEYWKTVEEPYIQERLETLMRGLLSEEGMAMSEVEIKMTLARLRENIQFLTFVESLTQPTENKTGTDKRYPYKPFHSVRG